MPDQSPQHSESTRPTASILVIDDEEALRGLVRAILEPMGYRIREAVDGRDGISCFRESPTDLVMTDMYMPRADGLTVMRELRADYPTVKILAVSGTKQRDEFHEALRLGAARMLAKPFGAEDLREAVAHCLLSRTGKASPSSSP